MIIQSFAESDCTATKYADYLRGQSQWADAQLSSPEVTWPNGRSSHAAARQVKSEAQEAYENLALDHGRFYANGHLAKFS